jgi:hypothetical protein
MLLIRLLQHSLPRGLLERRHRKIRPRHRRILRQIHNPRLIRSLRRSPHQLPLLDLQPELNRLNLLRILKPRRRLLQHRTRRHQQLQSQRHLQPRLHLPKNRRQKPILKFKEDGDGRVVGVNVPSG